MVNFTWQLKEFSEKVGKHRNTVDLWFKQLEEGRVHYVNRNNSGEREFDETDLKIAEFIRDLRDKRYSVPSIFELLLKNPDIDLRAVPEEVIDAKPVKYEDLRLALAAELERMATTRLSELLPGMIQSLRDPIQEKREEVSRILTRRRIERTLEEEAKQEWLKKPQVERIKKVGLFRKEEDTQAREHFIKSYIDSHFEERLLIEFQIES